MLTVAVSRSGGLHVKFIFFSVFLYIFQKFCNEHALITFLENKQAWAKSWQLTDICKISSESPVTNTEPEANSFPAHVLIILTITMARTRFYRSQFLIS
jgi:hypothetical protein